MDENIFVFKAQESGDRIDALLAAELEGFTRSAVQRMMKDGRVTVMGRPVKKNYRSTAGEEYVIELPEPADVPLTAQDIPLDIAYEDEDLIVVNKARGMVVHPAPGHLDGTLANALLYHCGNSLSGIGGEKRPGIVHRIDKDTSGLIIAAKNDFAHQKLSEQLSDHSLCREYQAIVHGNFREDAGTVDKPIGRHPIDRKKMAVTEKNSRRAVTHWEVYKQYRGYSHILCRLETGRTHQIRVHMASVGHPLLGDGLYGAPSQEKGLEGQCLHAGRLRFIHPRTGEAMEVTCPLPEYFEEVIKKLGTEKE